MVTQKIVNRRAATLSDKDERESEIFSMKIQKAKGKLFLSLAETGEILGVRYRIVQRYVKRGELPAAKIGGTWRIYVDDLYQFFRRGCRYNGGENHE